MRMLSDPSTHTTLISKRIQTHSVTHKHTQGSTHTHNKTLTIRFRSVLPRVSASQHVVHLLLLQGRVLGHFLGDGVDVGARLAEEAQVLGPLRQLDCVCVFLWERCERREECLSLHCACVYTCSSSVGLMCALGLKADEKGTAHSPSSMLPHVGQ